MNSRRVAALGGLVSAIVVACNPGSQGVGQEIDAAGAPRRWGKPPANEARAYPPHAIRSDGVGPYRINMQLSEVLHLLPEGPHVELLQLGRLADWRVVWVESGHLLIGADQRNRVSFIAVLAADVARTGDGMGVGTTGAELLKTLGKERELSGATWDRRVYELDAIPNVLFVTAESPTTPDEAAEVGAVVVLRDDVLAYGKTSGMLRGGEKVSSGETNEGLVARKSCRSGGTLANARQEIASVLRGRPTAPQRTESLPDGGGQLVRFGCFSGSTPEAVVLGKGELALIADDRGRLRRLHRVAVEGDSLAVVDVDEDGRDEIVVSKRRARAEELAFSVRAFRYELGRLVEIVNARPFVVSAAAAAAAGVTPTEVDVAVGIRPVGGAIVVGGLYLSGAGAFGRRGAIRVIAPIKPTLVRIDAVRNPATAYPSRSEQGIDETFRQDLPVDAATEAQ
ncbi:MAG: hypothetical protein V2A73_23215 [Pseudomonadota bacterium]